MKIIWFKTWNCSGAISEEKFKIVPNRTAIILKRESEEKNKNCFGRADGKANNYTCVEVFDIWEEIIRDVAEEDLEFLKEKLIPIIQKIEKCTQQKAIEAIEFEIKNNRN